MKTTYFIFFATSFFINIYAQTQEQREHEAAVQISTELQSIYGSTYYGAPFVDEINSCLISNKNGHFRYQIDDPYGTLKDCFVFVGYRNESYYEKGGKVVGVYKNGHIIWHSDTLNCLSFFELFTTRDLNNDGTVDLLFYASDDKETELWIFSWDGQIGRRINAVDTNGASIIKGGQDSFGLIDVEGDGIWEIDNFNMEDGTEGYSWNGQEYGHWANTPNTKPEVIPRNNINTDVSCRVVQQADTLQFNYEIYNKPISKQQVSEIFLNYKPISAGVYVYDPPFWSSGGFRNRGEFIHWGTNYGHETSFIRVGKRLNGFILKTKAICTILSYEAYGYNAFGKDGDGFLAKTIGPVDPSNPFIVLNFLDTLTSYTTQSLTLGWITTQPIANKYLNYFSTAKTQLQANNTSGAKATLQQVLADVNADSSSTLTSEAYALLRFNTEYLISKLPAQTTPYLNIALKNSSGTKLPGGTLQYYDASWKDAVNNNDGTFSINTTKTTLSLRMTYAYGSQQKNNVPVTSDTVLFQTVNAHVQLRNSSDALLDTGTVQYYSGAWRTFGTTSNGSATKELLPTNYTFRMSYAYGSSDKAQNIKSNPTIDFQTINTQIELKNSQGNLIDQGTVQYYSGAWRTFGTTSNGVTTKELLPNSYQFRMTHEYVSIDKTQNVGIDNTVPFLTVAGTVQVRNLQNNPVNNAIVTYYSGAWRTFGTTVSGQTIKELLPVNLQFRAKLGTAQADKTQNLSTNPLVEIQLP